MTINLSYQLPTIGDLIVKGLNGDYDVIVHGCNCFHTMGAGIAKRIKNEVPDAYVADGLTLYGDRNKLGQFSFCRDKPSGLFVVNAYTQYNYRGQGMKADYEAIRNVFQSIAIAFNGMKIAYPLISCGLAGGDWKIVQGIIDQELRYQWHQLVVFNQSEWEKTFGH